MAHKTQTLINYRGRLDTAVTTLSFFIHDLCPEAQLEISFTRYEDGDAHIWISLPATLTEEEREEIANRVAEKSLDILLAEGFLILAGVEEPQPASPPPEKAPERGSDDQFSDPCFTPSPSFQRTLSC